MHRCRNSWRPGAKELELSEAAIDTNNSSQYLAADVAIGIVTRSNARKHLLWKLVSMLSNNSAVCR